MYLKIIEDNGTCPDFVNGVAALLGKGRIDLVGEGKRTEHFAMLVRQTATETVIGGFEPAPESI